MLLTGGNMAKRFFYRICCGFFLGISVFAPGFSGSFIAIILGVYQDLVRIASNPFRKLKQNIIFCVPLGIGAAISAVLFVIFFRYLFDSFEKATFFLFIGLIAGNLPVIFKDIKACGYKWHYLIGGLASFAAALALGIFAARVGEAQGAQGVTAGLPLLALSGLAGGAAALVPGMSVSMILILMGVYGQLLLMAEAFLHLDLAYTLQFGLFGFSALAGLALASRIIKVVFEKFPGLANAMVFGFMTGSLIGILAQSLRLPSANFRWWLGALMLAAGLVVSMLFVMMARAMEKAEAHQAR